MPLLLLRRPHPGKVFLSGWDAGQRPRDWVVAAAQGELAAAREALDAWEASRQSSPDPARLLVGNQWARDRLEALLAAEGPPRLQSPSAQEATRVG